MSFFTDTCPAAKEFTLQNLVFWSMGYGGWMGVGVLPLLWRYTNNNMIRAAMAILSPTTCSLVMTTLFVLFYGAANFIWSVGTVMTNPVFLLSAMGSVCLSLVSVAMYFALPLYMQGKTMVKEETSDNESEDSENESQGSEDGEGSEDSENESQGSEDSEGSEDRGTQTVSDAESTDIEPEISETAPDNTWREQANFEGLRNAPELPA